MFDIYVINLDERKDKMDRINKKFGKFFNLIRIDAIKHEIGWIGCFLSHKKCLKIAKEKKMKNIFVIEDDCNPVDEELFYGRLINIIKILNKSDEWDIWLGGSNKPKPEYSVNISDECFIKIDNGRCTHMIYYNQKAYDFFLNDEMRVPIDCVWHGYLNALVSYPYVAFQSSDFSDILKKYVIGKNIMKSYEKKLGEFILKNHKKMSTPMLKY